MNTNNFIFKALISSAIPVKTEFHQIPSIDEIPWNSMDLSFIKFNGIPWIPWTIPWIDGTIFARDRIVPLDFGLCVMYRKKDAAYSGYQNKVVYNVE
jgi:hypothetical protein